MEGSQLVPFERNRYYVGKMLSSADFLAEQAYTNHKRRFLNQMMFGAGIVCGYSVFSLDDLSILVESGVAIDGLGREIVMPSAVVQKLSAMEGFEQLTTDTAALCLKYQEKETQPVYAVHKQEGREDYEYNRIREEFSLYLIDAEQIRPEYEMESEFLVQGNLLLTQDYQITLIMPATVCQGKKVKAVVTVEKLSQKEAMLSYHGVLQTPAFVTGQHQHEIKIELDRILLAYGETFTKEYWLTAQHAKRLETEIVLRNSASKAEIAGKEIALQNQFSLKIVIDDLEAEELVSREIGKMSLEMKNLGMARDFIHLADLKLIRTESAYLIDEVMEKNRKRYLQLPSQERTRKEYLTYFEAFRTEQEEKPASLTETVAKEPDRKPGNIPEIATGIVEIPLGNKAKRGEIHYSGEIMHGLGAGNVYVELGTEYIEESRAIGTNVKNTVYGSQELFAYEKRPLPHVETAVKVLHDKGSFIAAVRLKEEVQELIMSFRYIAMKFPTAKKPGMAEQYSGKGIEALTPTVVLDTRESHYFAVKFIQMESCSVSYELTESRSGEITRDGVYTAPGREGVYEIRIYCTDRPMICTYAYAVVKKKEAVTEKPAESEQQ